MAGILARQYHDEEAARAHLEKQLWPDGPICPHCGVLNEATKLQQKEGTKTHARVGTWKCNGCREQFTVTVGTIFEDSKIPLHKWLLAIHLMCSSKKGISAHQLMRNLELGSYRTAWFMAHRIRWAMGQEPMKSMLGGDGAVVEADEVYLGGREKGLRGAGNRMSKKVAVVALVERGGDVRSFPVKRVTVENLRPILKEHVDPKTRFVTDEHSVYFFTRDIMPKHHTVNHKAGEYVRREGDFKVTTNTVEGYFSLVQRGIFGVYHHWGAKYMGQYLREFDWRYNVRRMGDGERALVALKGTSGKRLMLKAPKEAT